MAKASPRSVHRCQACGHVEPRWLGKCPGCDAWNTLVEERPLALAPRGLSAERVGAHLPGAGGRPVPASAVEAEEIIPRLESGLAELDRVLGGGLVPGSLVLLGGDPGIG